VATSEKVCDSPDLAHEEPALLNTDQGQHLDFSYKEDR